MLKCLMTTEGDKKEAAIIEKRRKAEEQRKRRFFDAKQRILGIDSDELDRQLAEKEQALQAEKERERLVAEEMKRNIEIAEAQEQELQEQKRQAQIELNEYRKLCQQARNCDNFDLNDPEGKKKSLPARLDDSDPRLSKSGGQLFLGEDLAHKNRIREQKILQKLWLDQQIMERKNLEMNMKRADQKINETISRHDIYSCNQSDRMSSEKRELQHQIREYNESLAKQKRENERKRKEMEQQDNMAEIYNFLSSDLLKETQPKGSNLGPNRCIPYAYKHMNEDQIEKFKMEQEKQKADINRKRIEEDQQKQQWKRLSEETYREMTLRERALSRNIRQMNCNLREENEELAKQQKHKIQEFENVVNTNPPTEEFFNQFNTTSR